MSAARFAFRLAQSFDKAVAAAGDDPDDTDLVVRDMIERVMHWCDLHKVSFEDELEAGRELYKTRPAEYEKG